MRSLVGALCPAGEKAKHHVLIFHRVFTSVDSMMPSEPTVERFDQIIGMLKRNFEILPLADAVDLAAAGKLPAASVSITFDDGYADNYLNALPVLEAHQAPATFFIATGYLEGGRMWNDTIIETARLLPEGETAVKVGASETRIVITGDEGRRALAENTIMAYKYHPASERERCAQVFAGLQTEISLPDNLMLSHEQLQQLAASKMVEIGAHTVSHPIVAGLDDGEFRAEVLASMNMLEQLVGKRPRLFAYPNGKLGKDYQASQVSILQTLGLKAAVATDWGVMDQSTDPFQIPRFTPWAQQSLRFLIDMVRIRRGWI